MRASTTFAVLAGVTAAAAQVALPTEILGMPFGQQCQQAVLGAATNGSLAQCLPLASLLPLLSGQGSIIPVLDQFMTDLCYQAPCSNETLAAAASQIAQGCAADLQSSNLTAQTVTDAFSVYPTLREVLCLKTDDPYTEQSYGGALGPAPIPISDAYNQTDGTFCVSSLLTQLSAYYETNITIPFIVGAVTGSNQTARDLTTSIEANILCNECLFAAVGVVEAAYPQIANVTAGQVAGYLNLTVSDNEATLNSVMNDTCAYVPLVVSTTELPEGVTVSIVNSTFANPLDEANSTASA